MMTTLKRTKARLALLQAVDDGAVKKHFGIFPSRDYVDWDRDPGCCGWCGRVLPALVAAAVLTPDSEVLP